VPRDILWKTLEKKEVRIDYIQVIKDMSEGASTNFRGCGHRWFSYNNMTAPRINLTLMSFYFIF